MPLKVSASEYIEYLMTWVENQLNNENIFPSVIGVPFPKNFLNIIKVIFKRFEKIPFTCEYKYDGFRGQIHFHDKKTEVFSRNLENMTETYPDVVEYVRQFIKESQENTSKEKTIYSKIAEKMIKDLKIDKIDQNNLVLTVIGKGNKERVVPFTENCAQTLDKYIKKSRVNLALKQTFYSV